MRPWSALPRPFLAALMHILIGKPLTPREAERKGLVHETVSGKALDRAMELAQRLSSHTPESVAYIKRLVRLGGVAHETLDVSNRFRRGAAGTRTGARTKSLLEIEH